MDKEKLKVLFVSDLVVPTGFSTVAHNIIGNIENDFEFVGVGVNYRGDPHSYKFPIFPATVGPSSSPYGVERVVSILKSEKFDLLFILNDAWVISYYLDAIKKQIEEDNRPKIIVYFPVDAKDHNPSWYRDFDIVSQAVVYTEFGKKVVKQCMPDLDVKIIPHGVDTSTFYHIDDTRENVRRALFADAVRGPGGIGDLFIVLNANRNQPRKKLDITMRGFSIFAKNKPDVKLYMHCGARDSAIDVPYMSGRYGIDANLIVTNLAVGIQRVELPKLNIIYNACDVGINTSMGEGWGLTNMEHAVTGAAQIVPRHSSCEELFLDCGILMETSDDFVFDHSQTTGRLVTAQEVSRTLEVLYRNRELKEALASKAMSKFTAPIYQWKNIAQTWKSLFLEVCK